jgi:hypothetical protein
MTKSPVSRILSESTIWCPTATPGVQSYVGFRRVFELESRPDSAVLHIFGDSRYLLWVNGGHVLRGPARFHPDQPEYDSIEIGGHLRHGRNAIVVLVHHYAGVTNGRIMRHDPCLTACLMVDGRENLRTDPLWVCSDQTEYRPSPGAWSSIPDVIDARYSPGDWTGKDFDDSKWSAAVRIKGGSWGGFRERITPLCREEEITGIHVLPERHLLDGFIPFELRTAGGGVMAKATWANGCGRSSHREPMSSGRYGRTPVSEWVMVPGFRCVVIDPSRSSSIKSVLASGMARSLCGVELWMFLMVMCWSSAPSQRRAQGGLPF